VGRGFDPRPGRHSLFISPGKINLPEIFISVVRGWIARIYVKSDKTENSLFCLSAALKKPIIRQILRLRCDRVTPIPKSVSIWKDVIYIKSPIAEFWFSSKWSPNMVKSKPETNIYPIDDKRHPKKQGCFDLTINAPPFMGNGVSSVRWPYLVFVKSAFRGNCFVDDFQFKWPMCLRFFFEFAPCIFSCIGVSSENFSPYDFLHIAVTLPVCRQFFSSMRSPKKRKAAEYTSPWVCWKSSGLLQNPLSFFL